MQPEKVYHYDSVATSSSDFESAYSSKKRLSHCLEDSRRWISALSSYSTLHGFAWYNRSDSVVLKTIVLCAAILVTLALPVVVVAEVARFMSDVTVKTAVEWHTADRVTYPNITLCHSLYFSSERLRRYNISDDLANYMTIALDPYIRPHADFMSKMVYPPGRYFEMLDSLDKDLRNVMLEHDMADLLQLFRSVAINEMIDFCEDHRKFLGNFHSPLGRCCGTLFDETPIFSPSGTCFTTKMQIVETTPSIYSSIKIWLQVDKTISPDFEIHWRGSEAAEREGIYWTLSYEDHPARKLYTSPKKVTVGSSTIVALTKYEVDRSGLPEKCMSKNQTFEDLFGVESTRLNCEMLSSHFLVANCSVGVYSGLKQIGDIGPCMPADTLHHSEQVGFNEEVAKRHGYTKDLCSLDCLHSYFDTSISSGRFNVDSLNRHFSRVMNGIDAKNGIELQFYFETFDHAKSVVYMDGLIDFLSKIGGWMSIAVGASIISFIEIFAFLVYLVRVLFRNLTGV